ncbi:MAG: pyridoxamine kinase [Candidatus Cloacimonetes bacterium]|nr:pyridoxamine kinase [Candidatus Cloacimonadota bacterium]
MKNRVLAIHDLSGFGNTSLMAIIPLFYKYGLEVCALPSALLSSNTCYDGYRLLETDAFMKDCLRHWQEMKMEYCAIYSGFLGNPAQVDTVLEAINSFSSEKTLVLVDPVMADDGKLYSCYDDSMILAMRRLIAKANIITPNYTEACFLSGHNFKNDAGHVDIERICGRLHELGAREIIITGVPGPKDGCRIFYSEAATSLIRSFECRNLPCFFTGTGDIFSALMLIYTLRGIERSGAIIKAADFIYDAIRYSMTRARDGRAGVLLQELLQNTGE